jgi:hypothetical protein
VVNLDDAYAKHDRALHHFHKLHHAFEEYLDENLIATPESPALGAHLKPSEPGMVLGALWKLDLKAQPSRPIAAVVGDCVQNLRASLD